MHNFTTEELLEFLFHETSAEKNKEIVTALEEDWNLKEEYRQISEAKEQLLAISFSPSQKSIDNILNYAKLTSTGSIA